MGSALRKWARAIVVVGIGSGSAAVAGQAAANGQTIFVDPEVVVTVETSKGVHAHISPPLVPVTFSGLWYIEPGSYTIRREARVDGRRYALIPWARRQPDEKIILEEKKDKAGCRSVVQHFAAIDMETQELQNRTWVFTRSDCDIGDRWDQRFWLARGYTGDDFLVREEPAALVAERKTEADRAARLAEALVQEEHREQQRHQEALLQLEAPAKRQIGATVCKTRGPIGFAGYTEQVSPDTGRIRVRIVRHFDASNGRFLLATPPEENVWDDPDNWYRCEF